LKTKKEKNPIKPIFNYQCKLLHIGSQSSKIKEGDAMGELTRELETKLENGFVDYVDLIIS